MFSQKYLVYNHAAGIGDPTSIEHVRATMVGRINVHANGHSGNRLEITQILIDMLNKGVTPFVCKIGSVGASGDLAPMSQIALLMMGEGKEKCPRCGSAAYPHSDLSASKSQYYSGSLR